MNDEYYSKRPVNYFKAACEHTDRYDLLRNEVLDFCMYSSVCKQTNLSFVDIMGLDYPTFNKLKDLVHKRDEQVSREQNKAFKTTDNLMKEVKNARGAK